MSFYLPRVTHLDCLRLDDEVHRHFTTKLLSFLQNFHPSVSSWRPEVEMILKLFLWRHSVGASNQTIGQRLLSCHYSNPDKSVSSTYKLRLHAASSAFFAWLHARLDDLSFPGLSKSYVRIILACSKIVQTINAFVFLSEGRFASLSERFCGLTMRSSIGRTWNSVPSAFLLRELLWNGFSEFLVFLWPFIRRSRWLAKARYLAAADDESATFVDDESTCLFCRQSPKIHPHAFCAHSFCYFCVANSFVDTQFFICPCCGAELTSMELLKPVAASF